MPVFIVMNPIARSLQRLLPFVFALASLLPSLAGAQTSTMLRVHTNQGAIDIKLLDSEAPITVANFLTYVRAGDFNDSFFHRSPKLTGGVPFVIQGGGFRWLAGASVPSSVASRPAIVNEFSAARSNVRGTVAMAKLGNNPNSATNGWFVNMGNNSGPPASLDTQNDGFTVFGRVTTQGMVVADRIAALRVINAGGAYNELPVINYTSGLVLRSHVVLVSEVTELPNQTDADRVFNFLEAAYPQYLSPSKGVGGEALGYKYRYYAGSNAYIGTKDGNLYFLVPNIDNNINLLAPVADLLVQATQAGY